MAEQSGQAGDAAKSGKGSGPDRSQLVDAGVALETSAWGTEIITDHYLHATTWGADKKMQIAPTLMYLSHEESEGVLNTTRTEDISDLLEMIDQYIAAMIRLFEANTERSILVDKKPDHD